MRPGNLRLEAPSLHQSNAVSVVQHESRDQQQRGPGAQSDRWLAESGYHRVYPDAFSALGHAVDPSPGRPQPSGSHGPGSPNCSRLPIALCIPDA